MLIRGKIQWTRKTDIVIIGFGAAGAVAAITAHDKGAEVFILEKQSPRNHLSNSSLSGGAFVSVNNVPAAIEYMAYVSRADEGLCWTDKNTLRVWAEYSSQNKEWMQRLGARVELLSRGGEHNWPGRESIEIYGVRGLGHGFMNILTRQVDARRIPVMYDTAVDKLLTNLDGEIVGVRARGKGEHINIKASRAVIMALGGFEFDEEMKLNYLKVYPAYFAGSPANTGDGVRMVQEVGGALWHMNCCSASWVLKFPDFPIALGPNFRGSRGFRKWRRDAKVGNPCGFIIVDKYGKRYTNEEFKRHTVYYELALYDSQKLEYPRIPSYWIFDRRRLEGGPLPLVFYGPMLYRLYPWSQDNREEIKKGWIIEGTNIEDLALKLKMDPQILRRTIQDYNTYCERKEDPEFHRPSQHLLPVIEPPFFAVELWPGSANTQGGARRNHKAQVLNVDGEAIPRLYAAGEFGSVYGMLYPAGGGNLAECIAFGRIAGENATSESPL